MTVLVDTHVHVVAPDEDRYPLAPSGATGPWYRDDPCSVERLVELMDAAGVDRAVLVQAISAYGFDNRYAADAGRARADRCTSVACLDLDGPDPVGNLHRVVAAGMRGLRWVAIRAGALGEPRAVWHAADALRIPVVVTILADRLAELAAVVPALPPVPIALDHCAFADFSRGLPAELVALAAFRSVRLKVSTNALDLAAAHGDVADFVAELAARFGADRLMWGSDYSQTHDRPYPELVAYARRAASRLSENDRDAFLGGSALVMWPELAAVAA